MRFRAVAITVAAMLALWGCLAAAVGPFVPNQARASEIDLPDWGAVGGESSILPVGLDEADATYVTIARLADADLSLSDTLVSFRGEAVGEAVNAMTPGYSWVLLQQSTGGKTPSIQVLMANDQVALIENFGAYGTKGSTLLVTGIYRVADANQTGALDVTAYSVRVVEPGGPVEEDVRFAEFWVGLALVVVGLVLTVVNIYLKRRSRS